MVANRSPVACPLSPPLERCPQCGQERPRAELWHKHHKLTCCTACYQQRRLDKRQRWEQRNRARRTRQRHQGGVPCPPYVAWTVEAGGEGREAREDGESWTCVLYGPRGRAWPEALVTFSRLPPLASRIAGACSCGQAGCVHLVVACLAQQDGGPD